MKPWSILTILAAALTVPPAVAQTRVEARIPFPFVAHGKVHPAGEYSVERISSAALPILQMRRAGGGAALLAGITTYREQSQSLDGKLIFNRYGDQYFLSEIWGAGTVGTRLPPCREEKALLRAGVPSNQTVMFARLR